MSGLFSGSSSALSSQQVSLTKLACIAGFVVSAFGINAGASAQEVAAGGDARAALGFAPVCEIEVAPPEETDQSAPGARGGVIVALCGREGVVLGSVDRWRSFVNRSAGAVVVELESMGRKRIVLLQRDGEGRLSSENISGALAVAAGRSAVDGMQGLSAVFDRFDTEGIINTSPDGATARQSDLRASFSLEYHNRQRQHLVIARSAGTEGATQ